MYKLYIGSHTSHDFLPPLPYFLPAPSTHSPVVQRTPAEVMDVGAEEKVPGRFELTPDNVEHVNLIPVPAVEMTNLLPVPVDNGYGG